ncbi:MAG: efflux RND transporter periplasmic adaptor subunit [Verrucomicrobia bacterium]|nr:efflux RND transporter periplasmic adaptor subunit [Verrucomicrobiota bacterium]
MKWLCLLVILAACSKEEKKPFEMPPVPVQTASVQVRDVPLSFEAIGTIKPSLAADVRPQVKGTITAIHFTEGEVVEKGDLLYTIDDASYAIRVREAESALLQDLAHLSNEQKKFDRYKTLTKPGHIAPVEWDELQTKIALHEAMVKADEARLAAARLDLEHCKIVAPIRGSAGKTALQIGNIVGEQPLVKISQMDPLVVEFELTIEERKKLPLSPKIDVFAAGTNIASGHVVFLDHTIDPKSGMIAAKGVLTEMKGSLWAEESVRVQVYFGKKEHACLIPLRAIKTNQAGPYVYLVKEDKTVEIRPVELGPEEKGFVVVNLAEGKVVTEGHGRLFPGSKVEEMP